jgi:hypothetical protein
LDNFQLKEYIEEVTRQADGKAPSELEGLINAFEDALGETQRFKLAVQAQIDELRGSLCGSGDSAAASQLHRDAVSLMTSFDRAGAVFGQLERRFDQVGNVVVGAGQQMERLHAEKRRAQDAKEILQTFIGFTEGPAEAAIKLEAQIMSGALEARVRGAETLRRLTVVAGQEIPGAEEGVRAVHELAQAVENGLLADFHEAFEEGGREAEMRVAAAVLLALNGGQSCIQSFVNQHDFFLQPVTSDSLLTRYHPARARSEGGPAVVAVGAPEEVDAALATMFGQVVGTADEDWTYLEAVFERPWLVMDALLTRIFHEPVQVYVEAALQQARGHSPLAYLRSLAATHAAAQTLVADICRIYERRAGSSDLQASTLGRLVGDLLSPHLEPGGYQAAELAAAAALFRLATAPLGHALRGKRGSTTAGNVAKSVMSTLRMRPASPSDRRAAGHGEELQQAALFRFAAGEPLVSAEEGADGIPSPAVVARCLVLHAEATARLCSLLPEPGQRAAALEALWSLLLDALLREYVEAAIDAWSAGTEWGADSKAGGLDIAIIRLAATASQILARLQHYFQTSLLPLAVTLSPQAYRAMVQAKTEAFQAVAAKADALLQREIGGNLAWIRDSLLPRQRKSDFRPRADELQMLAGPSPACLAVVDFLRNVARCVLSLMDTANATLYLSLLGTRFHALLTAHIRAYSISDTGALLLRKYPFFCVLSCVSDVFSLFLLPSSDLRAYQEVVVGMGPAGHALKPSFDLLVEIGNVFLVRPENLRSLLQENLLAQLDSRLALQFVAQRADFRSARIDLLFPEIQTSSLAAFFAAHTGDL